MLHPDAQSPSNYLILIEHLDVQVGAHTDKLGHLMTWDRAPIVALRDTLKPGTNQISSPFGGLIYLIPTKSENGKNATVTISGAVKAPYLHPWRNRRH